MASPRALVAVTLRQLRAGAAEKRLGQLASAGRLRRCVSSSSSDARLLCSGGFAERGDEIGEPLRSRRLASALTSRRAAPVAVVAGGAAASALPQALLRHRRRSSGASSPPATSEASAEATSATADAEASSSRATKGAGSDGGEDAEEEVDIPPEVDHLFGTLRAEALRRLDEFGPIHLFSLCWAYSTARLLDAELEQRIQSAALSLGRARDLNPNAPREAESGRQRRPRKNAARDEEVAASDGGSDSSVKSSADASQKTEASASSEPAATTASVAASGDGPLLDIPSILVENEHWMALYKPPFWQVSVDSKEAAKEASVGPFEEEDEGDLDDVGGAEETRARPRMQGWVQQNCAGGRPIHKDAVEAFGLMHRLDVQTSGILMCAKTYAAAYWIRLQWCAYSVDKEYVCLVHGWVDKEVREIHKRIRVDKKKAPNSRRTISTHCSVSPSGKPSFTEVYTLAHLSAPSSRAGSDGNPERYSLVALKLHTGRTHQIRVHMQSIGHPLVCDVKYADDRIASDRLWCPRNFLHTYRLAFDDMPAGVQEESGSSTSSQRSEEDAASGETAQGESRFVEIFCPLPKDLRDTLETLVPSDEASRRAQVAWTSGSREDLCRFEEYAGRAEE